MTGVDTVLNASVARKSDLDRLHDAVGEVVGSVFYGTLLKTPPSFTGSWLKEWARRREAGLPTCCTTPWNISNG